MRSLCPVCRGKGSINDPKMQGMMLAYCGPNGERVPQVTCQNCAGDGWIGKPDAANPS